MNDRKIAEILGQLYEGAVSTSKDGWEETYRSLSSLFSAGPGSLSFYLKAEDAFEPLADTNEPGFIEDLNTRLFPLAPFRDNILTLRPGEIFHLTSKFPADGFRNTPFYQEHFKKNEIYRVLHLCLIETPATTAGISFTRPENMPDFSREEVMALRELTPHLQRAVNLHVELVGRNNQNQMMVDTLDKLPQALVVTDGAGKLVMNNAAADEFFGSDGVFQLQKDGSLSCRRHQQTNELKAIIESVFKGKASSGRAFGGVMNVRTAVTNRPVSILASPLNQAYGTAGDTRKYALLMITDPTGPIPTLIDDIRNIYDLTKKEAQVAIMVAGGKSVNEISDELGTSLNTVRTHVKHVLGKVGTNRQASLVRFILAATSSKKALAIFGFTYGSILL